VDDFDVVIVGAGMVGLALARALAGSGLHLAVADRAPRPAPLADGGADWDVRVYAISPGNQSFLAAHGAWPGGERTAPVTGMQVYGDAGGHIAFDAQEARTTHLATIVEGRLLLDAMWRGLDHPDLTVVAPASATSLAFEPRHALLRLADGNVVRTKLVVAADGAQSWVRTQAGMPASVKPYGHTAIVANFACERAHRGVAFQWFRADGVLALLPLPGNRCSLVWSAQEQLAGELLAMSETQLAGRVQEASAGTLGELALITPPAGFPLQLVSVPQLTRPRLALVGDAAHNLHPLAGQGVNLGLQDARELAQVLRGRGACADAGEHRLLRRYERSRREDIAAMTAATDGLQRLFGAHSRALSWLRNRGLSLVDRTARVKRLLVAHALG
jgi:ubiquinone biosynthesis UbiH/UbiF/VisC/COQ6 family hydroxylase